jgi:hypothetical protein
MRFLSDDEKIRIVVADILANYPKETNGKWKIPPGKGDSSYIWEEKFSPARPVPYGDIDEFFAINPNCCYVTKYYDSIYSDGGESADSFCMFGGKSDVVVAHYLFRYHDEKGLLKTELLERYLGINSCGKFLKF